MTRLGTDALAYLSFFSALQLVLLGPRAITAAGVVMLIFAGVVYGLWRPRVLRLFRRLPHWPMRLIGDALAYLSFWVGSVFAAAAFAAIAARVPHGLTASEILRGLTPAYALRLAVIGVALGVWADLLGVLLRRRR